MPLVYEAAFQKEVHELCVSTATGQVGSHMARESGKQTLTLCGEQQALWKEQGAGGGCEGRKPTVLASARGLLGRKALLRELIGSDRSRW